MSGHTPGPWHVVDGALGERVPVVTDTEDTMVARIPPGRRNAEADARLIAAAPDLLEELQHLVHLLEPIEATGLPVPGLATLNAARAAIAKATGGKP